MDPQLLQFHQTSPSEDFARIANLIMNDWVLSCNNKRYRIAELEFYLKSEKHFDAYTHGKEIQKRTGCWYVHPSGLDYTIGNEQMYASILIRAIQKTGVIDDPNNDGYTYGPINVLTEIFSNMDALEGTLTMRLEPVLKDDLAISEKPIAAPRVGLNPTVDLEKSKELYRFLILPKKKHANKTGIANAMRETGYNEEEIKGIWG